ncbi:hypothetical protein CI109_107359 [Kwoniella shandongensis]|uniref:Uncharacterized protein n=1 Tax=Kwoniella shandongensis TaxID=1734106 RepID=A0A5M6BVR4_9TREE|nr:uncharacterized protein CI109_004713 [Kwoniella shandongensis]KAA5526937.1 hypothetical protein CI109_004713 [Kwoniella shandongensis]
MSSLALPLPIRPSNPPSSSTHQNPIASTSNTNTNGNTATGRRRSNSPTPDLEDDEAESEDDKKKVSGGGGKKRRGPGGGAGGGTAGGEGKGEYKYTVEISQMMFVFGEVQDPLPETVKLVEDIVRGQIIEIVTRARLLTHLRSSRFLSAEDLIFLIRDDRGKVNRLRTYLSWKDVRKRAKDEEERGGGDVDLDVDGAGADADKAAAKGRKTMVKLPWELLTPFSDYLRGLPSKKAVEEDEEEDADEMQAYQDSMQRLRDADEITKKMTKDEYVHYSDCRQASFTYRKARRFRDFINFSAYLDVRPNDDIVDILGFLAFEMVRSLCVTALELRERIELTRPSNITDGGPGGGSGVGTGGPQLQRRNTLNRGTSPVKRKSTLVSENNTSTSPNKRQKLLPGVSGTEEVDTPSAIPTTDDKEKEKEKKASVKSQPISLFAPPPSARQPLLPCHVLEAFAEIQRVQAANRVGGLRNFKTGLGRARVALV